jgi:hypothetical protein
MLEVNPLREQNKKSMEPMKSQVLSAKMHSFLNIPRMKNSSDDFLSEASIL